jgi:hypothetical protein
MAIWTDLMGTSVSVTTAAYVAMTGSPYAPLKDAKLRKIIIKAGGDAATSLFDGIVRVRMSCPTFSGVNAFACMSTGGIRTAPVGVKLEAEQIVDLPVKTGVGVTVEIFHDTGATPVTPRVEVYGVFEG